jgi:hypothetical protein
VAQIEIEAAGAELDLANAALEEAREAQRRAEEEARGYEVRLLMAEAEAAEAALRAEQESGVASEAGKRRVRESQRGQALWRVSQGVRRPDFRQACVERWADRARRSGAEGAWAAQLAGERLRGEARLVEARPCCML